MIYNIEREENERPNESLSSDEDSPSTEYTENTQSQKPSLQSEPDIQKLEELIRLEEVKKANHDNFITSVDPEIKLEPLEDKRFPIPECRTVAAKFDPDDKFIAAACDDGKLRIYDIKKYTLFGQFSLGEDGQTLLGLKWRPSASTTKTKNVLICSDSSGNLFHLHVTTNQILHQIKEKNNQIYAVDYNFDATQFATAGLDCAVRVYDENKKSVSIELKDSEQATGHTNRVFCVKYAQKMQNILLSGGWDKTIQIWDTRQQHAIASIFGPEIAGDAIDFQDNVILTGSCRERDQLQLWDFGTRKKIANILWEENAAVKKKTYIYSAQFSKSSDKYIIAASSGSDQIRIFDRKNNNKLVKGYSVGKGLLSVDLSSNDSKFAYGGNEGLIGMCDVNM